MHPNLLKLLEYLSLNSASIQETERCGFLLGMVVERNSSQRSEESFYQHVLPEPFVSISLEESEYLEIVTKVASLLGLSTKNIQTQQALLFVLGGTDSRTLSLTIPALVRFLNDNIGRASFVDGVSMLRRMLSSPGHVQKQASAILHNLQGISGLDRAIERISVASESEATVVLEKLKALLQQSLPETS